MKTAFNYLVCFNHTALKLYSLWNVGSLLNVFYDIDVCSRINLQLYKPAGRPAFIKAPLLSGSMTSYWFLRVVATTVPRFLTSSLFRCPYRATSRTNSLTKAYAVVSIPIPSWVCRSRLKMSPREMSVLRGRPSDPSKKGDNGLRSRWCAAAWLMLCLSSSCAASHNLWQ